MATIIDRIEQRAEWRDALRQEIQCRQGQGWNPGRIRERIAWLNDQFRQDGQGFTDAQIAALLAGEGEPAPAATPRQPYNADGLIHGLRLAGRRIGLNTTAERPEIATLDADDWQPFGRGSVLRHTVMETIAAAQDDERGNPWRLRSSLEERIVIVAAARHPFAGDGDETYYRVGEYLDQQQPGRVLRVGDALEGAGCLERHETPADAKSHRRAQAVRAFRDRGWLYGSWHMPSIGSRRAWKKPDGNQIDTRLRGVDLLGRNEANDPDLVSGSGSHARARGCVT